MSSELVNKKHRLFVILCGIFVTNALVAEMIGVKIFSGEATLGVSPAQLNIFGNVMDFNLTAGVVIWPVVFITSDLINEYFGRRTTRVELRRCAASGYMDRSFGYEGRRSCRHRQRCRPRSSVMAAP